MHTSIHKPLKTFVSRFSYLSLSCTIAFITGYPSVGYTQNADPLSIPDQPLFTGINVTSNIMMLLDDSGSMDNEIIIGDHYISCSYDNIFGSCNGQLPTTLGLSDWFRPNETNTAGADNRANQITPWSYLSNASDNLFVVGNDGGSCPGEGDSNEGGFQDLVSIKRCEVLGYDAFDQDWRFGSFDHNLIYFNPSVTYEPWVGFNNASFTSARSNPQLGTPGFTDTENLGAGFGFSFFIWEDTRGFTGAEPNADTINMTDVPNGIVDYWDRYTRVTIQGNTRSCLEVNFDASESNGNRQLTRNERTLPAAECSTVSNGQSVSQMQQNIANWYQYSRKRILTTRGALLGMLDAAPNFRYAALYINRNASTTLVPNANVTDFTAHNQGIINDILNEYNPGGGTPLRTGLETVGRYFAGDFNVPDPIIEACQKNFSLVFTDGFWGGVDPSNLNSADVDGDSANIINEGQTPTLADVAHDFYTSDLSTLENVVPPDSFDDNPAQHLVTYSVAFGLEGALVDLDGDSVPDNIDDAGSDGDDGDQVEFEGDPDWWQTGTSESQQKIDDLWHAAYNSNGQFISAQRPEELTAALRTILLNISDRTGTGASAAANGGSLQTDSALFQARFNSGDWSGELLALGINSDGTVNTEFPIWDASEILNQQSEDFFADTREIFTFDPDQRDGIEFKWASLTTEQQALLNVDPLVFDGETPIADNLGPARAAFIRGVDNRSLLDNALSSAGVNTNSINLSSVFRSRNNKLGDLINSDPEFVGTPRFFYPFDDYNVFTANNFNRTPVIYVGGNDGMLHAFNASTTSASGGGDELFTYIPNAVVENLPELPRFAYNHEFYVDGSPTYGDIQLGVGPGDSDGTWRSVLIGGLRSGGQAIYALDVTDPTSFTSDFANNVLWEFTDEDDPDLGFTFARPNIVRLNDNRWAAIFGNGYNSDAPDTPNILGTNDSSTVSSTGDPALFIVFIEAGIDGFQTGDFIKIPVPNTDPDEANGLGPASGADINGDTRVDFIYAGDLQGNLWKFDVTSTDTDDWEISFNDEPLFTAVSEDGTPQPITSLPTPVAHPAGLANGALIAFGTGQYIESDDTNPDNQSSQTFYAVWDRAATLNPAFVEEPEDNDFARNDLAEVNISTSNGFRFINTSTSDNPEYFDGDLDRGFFIDLPTNGERVVREVISRGGTFFFVTLIPSNDLCLPGGNGFLSAININQPAGFDVDPDGDGEADETDPLAVFDINGDGIIDFNDDVGGNTVIGLEQSGIPNLPAIIFDPRTFCERNPSADGCTSGDDDDEDGGGDGGGVDEANFFPPPLNGARACNSNDSVALLFTTTSDGNVTESTAGFPINKCGRQAWRQLR